MFTSILCPVDFSPHAARALGYAQRLAELTGAPLTVMTALDPLLCAAADAANPDESFAAKTRVDLRAYVEQSLEGMSTARAEPELLVAVGKAAPLILEAAASRRADVIVMGTQGLSGARRVMFGSTTEGVLRDSTIPVLAVPPADGT